MFKYVLKSQRAFDLSFWRGFNYFNHIVDVSFSDATKLEHNMKVRT